TCLAVLADDDAARCPLCRSKLKGRRGVVLREETRIASKPTLAVERERKARVDEERAAAESRRYTPATQARLETPHAPRLLEVEAGFEAVPEPQQTPAPAPAPPEEPKPRALRRRDRRGEPHVVHEVEAEVEA